MEIVYSKQSFKYYEKLIGFENVYSRRINIQHRLVYEVRKEENVVVIIRMWTHYE